MKLELTRNELVEAVKCYVSKQGIVIEDKEVTIKISGSSTIVNIEDKQEETLIETDGSNPFKE